MGYSDESSLRAIADKADAIYARLRPTLEPLHNNKIIVINTDTGDFDIDADDAAASLRMYRRFPGAPLHALRIGAPAVYRVGGHRGTAA